NSHLYCFLSIPPPPRPTLFPYTTLFRSAGGKAPHLARRTASRRRQPTALALIEHSSSSAEVSDSDSQGTAILRATRVCCAPGRWRCIGERPGAHPEPWYTRGR